MGLLVAQQIGPYLIERELGSGGMGVVYVGIDQRLGRRAAIKQLRPELSGDREIVERFFNEAKAAANISHPGIIQIYDVGWHVDGSAYFAMKLLDGDSLKVRLRRGALAISVAATIARQVASALDAAHAARIVHRDLKPDNIVLVRDDELAIGERAIVLDFGIAKLVDDRAMSRLTQTGHVMGTPAYMSPEQCRGAGGVDHRTDIYALGCILFEMLTGRRPFVGVSPGEEVGMHQFVEPPKVRSRRTDVPPVLDALVMRCLAKQPDARYATMGDLVRALQPFASGGVPPTQPDVHPEVPQPGEPSTTLTRGRGEIVSPPGRRRVLGAAVAGVGVVVAAIVAVVAGASHSTPSAIDAAIALTADASVAADALASAEDATVDAAIADLPDATIADAAPRGAQLPALLARARRELHDHHWQSALDVANQALQLAPKDATAQQLYDHAVAEKAAEVAFTEIGAGLRANDLEAARRALAKINSDSMYYTNGLHEFQQGVTRSVAATAKQLAAEHKCAELTKLASDAERLSPGAGAAAAVPCVESPQPRGSNDHPLVTSSGRPVDEVVGAAAEAYRNGHSASALRLAEEALGADPSNEKALTAAVLAACTLKDADTAKKYLGKLSGRRQDSVRQYCVRNGVPVE